MTQLTLTLGNYLTKPFDFVTDIAHKALQALEEAQMKRAVYLVKTRMMQYRSYRKTFEDLSKLTDKELNDIGVSRGDIHSIAMESYYDNLVNRKSEMGL